MEEQRLDLEYPCPWDYRIIGEDEARIRIAVAGIIGNVQYLLTLANRSQKARYCSLQLTLEVKDEKERLEIFEALREHEDIRYVL